MPTLAELIPKMWEVLNSFSKEAQKAALKKCKELGFDPNRGDVPLEESLINLDSSSQILRDAIEKKKLIQLPLTIQKELLSKLEAISQFLTGLNAGTDEVINLTSAIEQLNTVIWQYGLHNLSDEVLGYQTKMNQLKNEEVQLKTLKDELEMGLKLKSDLQALLDETKAAQETVKAASAQTTTAAEKATTTLQEIVTVSQSASAHAATTEQNETTSTKQVSIAKTSTADIQALELKIKEFYAQIDQYREKIDTTSTDAQKAVEGNTLQTKSLIGTLDQLEARIKDQIEKATGYSLFHSFQTRQESLAKAKYVWGVVLAILVAFSMGLSAYVIQSTTDFSVAFYLKLSMSIPLIYAISFCTIQYSRERKLEEEYAFKSAISISLDPYQTLVNRIINQDKPAEREKFTDFIVDSIKKVFTSPTDKIFEPKERNKGVNEKSLKQVAEIVGSVTKAMKP